MQRDRYVYKIYAGDALHPFYVGVAKIHPRFKRERAHFRPSTWRSNRPKCEFIADCLSRGVQFRFEYERDLTVDEAHAREIELIAHYGRRDIGTGCLFNACAGGWGSKKFAPSTVEKLRAFRHSPETRAHLARVKTGQKHSAETLAKIRANRFKPPILSGPDHPNWKDAPTKQCEATRRYRARKRGLNVPLQSRRPSRACEGEP